MPDPISTFGLLVLTAAAIAAAVAAIARLRRADAAGRLLRWQDALLALCAVGSAALFGYRWLALYHRWQPLEAHVDGLLLIAAIFAVTLLFLEHRARLPGLNAFALPLLSVLLAWGVCASVWTFHPFGIDTLWAVTHRAGVYLGTLGLLVAASAGGMFLYVQRKLREKRDLATLHRLGSLETIERAIVVSAGAGFALLTVGLLTGVVIAVSGPTRLGTGWWHTPKVVLATSAWLVAAVVMNVRHARSFRGARAAWLSIAGVVLLLATFAAVSALERPEAERASVLTPSPLRPRKGEGRSVRVCCVGREGNLPTPAPSHRAPPAPHPPRKTAAPFPRRGEGEAPCA